MWKLVIEDDEGKRTVVPLTRDDYSIGRKEGNTIRLTERNVSRDHAKLRKKNGGGPPLFALEDCTSYNGVYVNGLRVAQAHDLTHGDLIQIGDYRIVLQDDAVTDQSAPPLVPDDMKATIPTGVATATRGSLLLERPNRLVMLAGPTPGAEYPLNQERMTVGRAEDASISINHNSVSRLHCEIHSLGEGRYEIVDKGSSNGVRVNSSDLRRGIIEAGDIIELGDVKFKFVGAGQIFLPGVNDSQQLESIGDRAGTASTNRRSSSLVPFIFFGALAAAVMVGGWAYKRQRAMRNDNPPVSTTPEDVERSVLTEAKRICDMGRCEEAHDRILAGIPASSALREADDFRLIEVAWANGMLERAEQETDVQKRKAMLHAVERTETVDATRRKQANERLQTIEKDEEGVQPPPRTPIGVKDAGARAVPTAASATQTPRIPPPNPTTAPTHTTPKPPNTASGSVLEEARALSLTNPAAAKQKLLARFSNNVATRDELCFLRILCKQPPYDMVLKSDVQNKLAEKGWSCSE
jgi:pSer/pThr/pTyr-binding forkhead associated (FHA) protein